MFVGEEKLKNKLLQYYIVAKMILHTPTQQLMSYSLLLWILMEACWHYVGKHRPIKLMDDSQLLLF